MTSENGPSKGDKFCYGSQSDISFAGVFLTSVFITAFSLPGGLPGPGGKRSFGTPSDIHEQLFSTSFLDLNAPRNFLKVQEEDNPTCSHFGPKIIVALAENAFFAVSFVVFGSR